MAIQVNNLGGVLQDMGDLEGARARYERALGIDEGAYGPDHPQVAVSLNNLGGVLVEVGAVKEARARFERALQILRKSLGDRHPNTVTARRNLETLDLLERVGEMEGDEEMLAELKEALKGRREQMGGEGGRRGKKGPGRGKG